MTTREQKEHDALIVDQFTKQAVPFTQLKSHLDSVQTLIEWSKVARDDLVLDVACGPGLVACEFAKVARQVTGIDITEEMIAQARKRQNELGLKNISWDVGSATLLPYDTASFSVVVTRYSFHHFMDPNAVLCEMIRVCKPGGIVLIADVALPVEKVDAFNRMEKLRDPSHTQALSHDAWERLLLKSGLKNFRRGSYPVEMELEKLLKSSFPKLGDEEKIRGIFRKDVGVDLLGMAAHKVGSEIHFSYPIAIYVGEK